MIGTSRSEHKEKVAKKKDLMKIKFDVFKKTISNQNSALDFFQTNNEAKSFLKILRHIFIQPRLYSLSTKTSHSLCKKKQK